MVTMKRMSSILALAFGAFVAASPGARAGDCAAQTGKAMFQDSFKDTSGGFAQDDQAKFGPSGLQMTLGKTEDSWKYVTTTFNATNGDFCAVATVPPPVNADDLAAVGITILYVDDDNLVGVYVYSDNTVQIERRSKGEADLILNEQNPDIKATPGSDVSVRAVVKDGSITAYVNGIAFKPIRVQVPDGADKFGLYVALDKVADKEVPFTFKSLRVTAP